MRFNFRHIVPLFLLSVGCGVETRPAVSQPTVTEVGAREQTMLQASDCAQCLAGTNAQLTSGFERELVTGDIYHYRIRVQVGPDAAHDVIYLHRVVRERAAWQPARSPDSVFMVHGDLWDFQGAFMTGSQTTTVPVDQSIAVYLAQQGVDVWGIDLRWTQVPLGTQDFSFMKGWNLGTHAGDVGTGLVVARAMRLLTGSGGDPMTLLGWSRGAVVAYAYLNAESQQPTALRNVSGFIPMDMVVKFGPEAAQQRQWACVRAQIGEQALQQGRYEGSLSGPGAGLSILQLGQAALAYPNVTASAPLPPLTYRQLGITLGAATFTFQTDAASGLQPPVPFYHFTAGTFGADGSPTGLQFVSEPQLFSFFGLAHPYQSLTEQVETDELMCGQRNLPYDDHFQDVKVPVLYVESGGGYGAYCEYTVKTLLGSKDVSFLKVQRLPDSARVADYGHADLFQARDARTAVWAPVLEWLKRH